MLCLVMLADLVHGAFSYTSIVSVAGYNSSAQLAGDSRNTRHMLYLACVKALLHSTACAQLYSCWIGFMLSFDELRLIMLPDMLVH